MNPTTTQQLIINSTHPKILVIAGAGSGKTGTLVGRIQKLIREGVSPAQMVAITFTNAAAGELLARLGKSEGREIKLAYCGTLHSFMVRVIRRFGNIPPFSVLDEKQAEEFLQETIKDIRFKGSHDELRRVIGDWHNRKAIVDPSAVQLAAQSFFQRLNAENIFTFDLLLTVGLQVVQTIPQDRWSWPYLFVDEYQDSGVVDALIYEAIPSTHDFFVGDPNQSIFAFRGGRVANIIQMSRRADVQVHRMTDNFRSGKLICQAAERLMTGTEFPAVVESRTGSDGDISIKPFNSPGQELFNIGSAAQQVYESGRSVAILLRTNALVSQWTQTLKSMDIPVKSRRQFSGPEDWRKLMNIVAFCSNPNNDRLAMMVLTQSVGDAAAREVKKKSMVAFSTVNQESYKLTNDQTAAAAIAFSHKIGISHASLATAETILKSIAIEDPSATDLMLALSRFEFHSESGEGVLVATYHAAKGLEFESVFLPCFENEVIPGTRQDANVEEDRRLAYVGVTRAISQLVISYSATRQTQWDKCMKPASPSRFLKELMIQ